MKNEKWSVSQKCEREWWLKWKDRVPAEDARKESIGWANAISATINKYMSADAKTRILQIGPAANGEIHHLSGERYAIDPLASFYTDNFPMLMDKNVKYIDGTGEALPYANLYFDVILIINVLDHCSDPLKVLSEIDRCLKNGGLLILRVYTYSRIVSFMHSIFNFLDKEHPHAITRQYVESKLKGRYSIKEMSFEEPGIPQYNIFKKVILLVLKYLKLGPVAIKLAAIKK
jgi:SAM-dependent methyltransferase